MHLRGACLNWGGGGAGAGAGAGGIYLAYCTQHAVYNITRHAVQHNNTSTAHCMHTAQNMSIR